MNELIKIEDFHGKQAVSARELYSFLEATERFSNWIIRQFQYGFEDNIDYAGCKVFNTQANQELQDYFLTIDTAKEISMLQKSDKGKQARRYFIECEKAYHQVITKKLPESYPEALRMLADAEEENLKLLPKAQFADDMTNSDTLVNMTMVAKKLGTSAVTLNRFLYMYKVIYMDGSCWVPYAKYQKSGYFDIKTYSQKMGDETKIRYNLKVTQKGYQFIYDLWYKHNPKPKKEPYQPELMP
jgi:anti-repressor protein